MPGRRQGGSAVPALPTVHAGEGEGAIRHETWGNDLKLLGGGRGVVLVPRVWDLWCRSAGGTGTEVLHDGCYWPVGAPGFLGYPSRKLSPLVKLPLPYWGRAAAGIGGCQRHGLHDGPRIEAAALAVVRKWASGELGLGTTAESGYGLGLLLAGLPRCGNPFGPWFCSKNSHMKFGNSVQETRLSGVKSS